MGFVVTNEQSPIGCCYLKAAIQPTLGSFPNNIGGQVYVKSFTGTGTQPDLPGFQFKSLQVSSSHLCTHLSHPSKAFRRLRLAAY